MSNTKPEAKLTRISRIVLDPELNDEVRLPALIQLYNSLPESEKATVDLIASGLQQRNLVLNEGAELRGIMAILLDRKLVGEDRGPALELLARYLGRDGAPMNPAVVERAARQLLYPSAIPPELSRDDLVEKRARQIVGVLRDATCLREAFAIAARTSPELRAILTRRKDFYLDANGQPRSGEIGLSASGKFKAMFAGICGTSEGRGLLRIAIDAGNRETRDRFWKSASSKRPLFVPCVVVGAGPSSVVYRSAVATLCPGQAPVVIDRRGHSGGQFAEVLNPVFGLNSRARPMRGDDPRGNLPGVDGELNSLGPYAVVQQSDLTGSAFGDQSSIGLAVEINHTLAGGVVTHTMLNRWAAVTTETGEQRTILELQRGDTGDKAIVQTGRLVSARGFQKPRCAFEARPGEDAPAIEAAVATRTQEILAQERDKANSGERSQYRLFPRFMADMGDRSAPFPLQAIKTVAVLGAGDSGCVTVQALLGYGPSASRSPLTLDRVLRVDWYGQESLTKEEYARDKSVPYQLLAGEFRRESEPTRPFRVQPFKDKAAGLDRDEQGRLCVVDSAGDKRPYDLVVDCSGFVQTPLEQLYDPTLESLVKGATEAQLPSSGESQSETVAAAANPTSIVSGSNSRNSGEVTAKISSSLVTAARGAAMEATILIRSSVAGFNSEPLRRYNLTNFYNSVANPERDDCLVQLVSYNQLAKIPLDESAFYFIGFMAATDNILPIAMVDGDSSIWVKTSASSYEVLTERDKRSSLQAVLESRVRNLQTFLRGQDRDTKELVLVSTGALSNAQRNEVVRLASSALRSRQYETGPANRLQDPQLVSADVRLISCSDLRSIQPSANSVLFVARYVGTGPDGSPKYVPLLCANGTNSIELYNESDVPIPAPTLESGRLEEQLAMYGRRDVGTGYADVKSYGAEVKNKVLLRAVPQDATTTALAQPERSSNNGGRELKLDQVMDIVGGDLVPLAQQVSGLEVYMIGPEARLTLTQEQLERRKAQKTPQNLAALFFHSSPITALAENHAANPIETPKSQLAVSRRGQPSALQRVKRASSGSLYSIDEASLAMPSADVSRLLGDTTDPRLVVQMFVQSAFRDCIGDRGETRPYALVLSLGKSGGSKPKRVIRVDSTHAFPSPIHKDPMFGAATRLLLSRLPRGESEAKVCLEVPLVSRDGEYPQFQWHRAAWSVEAGQELNRAKKGSTALNRIRASERKNQAGGQESE